MKSHRPRLDCFIAALPATFFGDEAFARGADSPCRAEARPTKDEAFARGAGSGDDDFHGGEARMLGNYFIIAR